MKKTEKKKPIDTIPHGVWEATHPDREKEKNNRKLSETTDLQGNGYPVNRKENP